MLVVRLRRAIYWIIIYRETCASFLVLCVCVSLHFLLAKLRYINIIYIELSLEYTKINIVRVCKRTKHSHLLAPPPPHHPCQHQYNQSVLFECRHSNTRSRHKPDTKYTHTILERAKRRNPKHKLYVIILKCSSFTQMVIMCCNHISNTHYIVNNLCGWASCCVRQQ